MNYEEKYKQALKKAKGIYIDATKEHCAHTDWLESIFPELAESEDERIRKEIIDFVVDNTICKDGRREKYLAWLEKQGKQNPVEESWPNLSNCLHDCKNCTGRCIYRKEEYQKQKSVEWSEEDEKMASDTIRFIETGWTDNGKSHLIPWLKSLKHKYVPQEWSEEDTKILSCISMALTDTPMIRFANHGTSLKQCLDWLHSKFEGFIEL